MLTGLTCYNAHMKTKKLLLIVAGFTSLALGVVGIVLPLLPTTPFVLLSAACFSRCNKKLENWLLQSRVFGPFIENYRTGQGISKLHKIASVVFLWAGLISTMVITREVWIAVVLLIVGVGVTTHILLIKTKRSRD